MQHTSAKSALRSDAKKILSKTNISKRDLTLCFKAILNIISKISQKNKRGAGVGRGKRALNIMIYCPFGFELDIFPLIFYLKKHPLDFRIFAPKVSNKKIECIRFSLPLKRDKLGILAPNGVKSNLKLDVVIVPILGMDYDFARVGFGLGLYDRFMHGLRKKPAVIFATKKLIFSSNKLGESHDIRGDFVICKDFCAQKRLGIGNASVFRLHNNSPICRGFNLFNHAKIHICKYK
ncbi:MAG: 5-formyltetrahydrofolate cyclo-ligase [Helicobacter sp.]|nr:5-formyltetrahydrofolate cyclo-ligase [Helicobacter sp.]